MSNYALIQQAMEQGCGILRLAPVWVPRSFCRPGMRIKLHPSDTYALGASRGGIDERWLSSTTHAENGPLTPDDEGLSYIIVGKEKLLLRDFIEQMGAGAIGSTLWQKYHRWPIYSKFFDNLGPLPHHVHHSDAHAQRVNQSGKPEMYFFPAQMNNYGGEFPYTFFGLNPCTTQEQLKGSLENFSKGDNALLELSRCYKLALDTGWDVPPGVLHAPGSLCTYEPQFASDVYAMYQSVLLGGHVVPENLLWKDCPPEEMGNIQYLISVLDWQLNTDPLFYEKRFMSPEPIQSQQEAQENGWLEEWICYRCEEVSAKRLTIEPGQTATIHDQGAYGIILLEGHGTINGQLLETPTLIRYGQSTLDEYFITYEAATAGVTIRNASPCEPLVLLKHFAGRPGYSMGIQ